MIPSQSRVFVETTTVAAAVELEDKNKEKQKKNSNSNHKIIDLSTETDSDDDRDPTTIVPHSPPTKRAKTSPPATQDAGSSSSSEEDDDTADMDDDDVDPTTVDHTSWIYQYGKLPYRDQKVLGKWLVFDSANKIAQTWRTIRQAVASATIPSVAAKVSTRCTSNNNKSYVICVYSSVELMDDVARALIPLVRRNISFKTDEATGSNRYAHNTTTKVTVKTLYWNRGRPAFIQNTAKLMTPVQALTLAVQTAAQYKKNNTTVSLDYAFDIIVTCIGIQHHIPSLAQRRQLLVEGGVTELVLIRDPDNEFDPRYAIRVELLRQPNNDNTTCECNSRAANNNNNSNKPTTTTTTVVGYLTSTTQPHDARLLAPFLDRKLLRMDSAKCWSWANRDSTALDIAVSGRAVREAQPVLEAL
jgi:hypothetical protein